MASMASCKGIGLGLAATAALETITVSREAIEFGPRQEIAPSRLVKIADHARTQSQPSLPAPAEARITFRGRSARGRPSANRSNNNFSRFQVGDVSGARTAGA